MPLRRHPRSFANLALALIVGSLLFGQPAAVPAWLVSYPGASAQSRTTPGLVEVTYQTKAAAVEVTAHYRTLFEAAGVSFHPNFDGVGTSIRGTAPEGDLLILIRREGEKTSVRVDVSAKSPALTAVPPPPPAPPPAPPSARQRIPRAEQTGQQHVQNMEKYDQPMRPPRRPPPPPLVWPSWLVHMDGARLEIEKSVDRVGLKTLHCRYTTAAERNAVQAFYAGLLNEHGFPVRSQSGTSWPTSRKAWIEAADHALGEGPKLEIRVELGPYGDATEVDLRITARP